MPMLRCSEQGQDISQFIIQNIVDFIYNILHSIFIISLLETIILAVFPLHWLFLKYRNENAIEYYYQKKKFSKSMQQQQPNESRSKIKRRCRVKTVHRDGSVFLQPKLLLSHYLQMDYQKQTFPHQLSPKNIETYGAYNQHEIRMILGKMISKNSLQRIIIDAMKVSYFLIMIKLCYLYNPIMLTLQTELKQTRDQYRLLDVMQLIYNGSFYPYLTMRAQPASHLVNNRSTQINVKSLVSGILAFVSNRLTIENLSDTVLFYMLEQALYDTAPNGLPYDFKKIIETIRKIDRTITGENFNKWERKITEVQHNISYLQPHHFVYLISLSEPIRKKKANIFQLDSKESKFQKQTEILNVIKEKSNLIERNKRVIDWRMEIKVRGLTFQERSKSEKIQFMEKQFVDMRKKIISHKRTKSAYVTSQAIQLVKEDLKRNNLKENQYVLDTFLAKSCFRKQNERTLLKKHTRKESNRKQFQKRKIEQQQKFKEFYNQQLKNHLAVTPLTDDFTQLVKPSSFPTQEFIRIQERKKETVIVDPNKQKMMGSFHKNTKMFKKSPSKLIKKGK